VKAIVSPTFSFKEFPAIGVELRYVEDKCGPQAGALDLGQARPEGAWSFRSITERLPPYEYRMIYRKAAGAGGDILTPWRTGVDELLSVSDPIPVKRPLNLFFSMPWDEISVGFIQIRYRDDKNGISYDEQIDLDPSVRYVRRDYPIDKSGPRTIAYRLTVLFKKGLLLDGQWRETDEDRLAIDSRLVENRMVRYQTIGGGLDENRLSKVGLRLQARDPGNSGVRAEKEFVLSPGNEPKTMAWEYLSGDPPAAVYFEGLFVDKDGFVSSQSWKEMRSEMLVINLRAKTMDA
jgi:hypothetical protein